MASPNSAARQETSTTTVTIQSGHEPAGLDTDMVTRSILKTDSRDNSSSKNITFAEQATVAQVIEGSVTP